MTPPTEHLDPGEQRRRLVQTVDRDEPDEDELARVPPVCYFIVAGNEDGFFTLDSHKHDVMVGMTSAWDFMTSWRFVMIYVIDEI